MTKEDKELLIIDLSARLPYEVKINLMPVTRGKCATLNPIILYDYYVSDTTNYLPYLRPMSSMTEEEVTELAYKVFQQPDIDIVRRWVFENKLYPSIDGNPAMVIDWLNAHHFDYRGLIEKGLALEATSETYNKQ